MFTRKIPFVNRSDRTPSSSQYAPNAITVKKIVKTDKQGSHHDFDVFSIIGALTELVVEFFNSFVGKGR